MEQNTDKTGVALSTLDPRFKEEIAGLLGNLDLAFCFQCGVCSGSCPTAGRMEFGPRKIMQMIRLGMANQLLRSHDMWLCVSCYTCTARCPQGIPVASVMGALRNLSLAKGMAKDAEATFSRVFTDVVGRHGRMFEPELLVRYYARTANLPGILKQASLGLTMLRKGKLALRPERIEDASGLKEITARVREDRGGTDR